MLAPFAFGGGAAVAAAAYANAQFRILSDLRESTRLKIGEKNLRKALATQTSPCFELFRQQVSRYGEQEAVWTRAQSYSWREALDMVCRYAVLFSDRNVGETDVVAFYLMNSADLVFAWMALISIGAIPAMINWQLSGEALKKCVGFAGAKLILVGSEESLYGRVHALKCDWDADGVKILVLDESLKLWVNKLPCRLPSPPERCNDALAVMYTSGSTGTPKAMLIAMQRAYCTASVSFKTFGQRPGLDRTYYCIPLYHGTGGLAAMIDLMGGVSIALAPQFSVSRFWRDCVESKSTIALYVGEILRFLTSASPSSFDQQHSLRLVWGNGLRPDVWEKFQKRFTNREGKTITIGEFYAATEGVLTLVNHSRNNWSLGAVGHQGWLSRRKTEGAYVSVRIDPLTNDMYRGPSGFAQETPLNEGGEILIRVPDRNSWKGYLNADEATSQKFVSNVLEAGDLFYRTGDALRRTSNGLWFFLDRLGDTYRWKGENVSTTEVAEVLGRNSMVTEANVYGVLVPGHEGRAGCAALQLNPGLADDQTWRKRLAAHLRTSLPAYAVPIFLRIVASTQTTTNYKLIKGGLREEGVEPAAWGTRVEGGHRDQFFWLRPNSKEFEEYGPEQWRQLESANAKL